MQMYLQHQPCTSYPGGDPFSPTNVGDEADTVYHEYTHGLSNRLNVDVQRSLAPSAASRPARWARPGATGTPWTTWSTKRLAARPRRTRPTSGSSSTTATGVNFDRTEPIDCKVGQTARLCNGGATGHRGGYTYADYGNVVGGPEVHGDGEIWAQTLWDLRDAARLARSPSRW